MEQNNESFECAEEDNISWKEVYDKIPRLLKMIEQILIKKSEDNDDDVNTLEFLKDFDLGIKADEPYIMHESDFDDTNFYKYILKIGIYYLKQKNINTIINKLDPSIYKHLIDLCAIMQKILKEEKNYEKRDVKYYIYHIINAFSDVEVENKLEKDFKFLKCGIELLLKAYNITDYDEYFSQNDKDEIRRNFCLSIRKLLLDLRQYMIKNKYLDDDKKVQMVDKIDVLCGKARKLSDDETDINFRINLDSLLSDVSELLKDDINFTTIYKFILFFSDAIPENLNDFYYSIFCFDYLNKLEKYKKKFNEFAWTEYRKKFNYNSICESETKQSLLKYLYQFTKNERMHYKLISGMNSNKKYFEELLNDKKFREKIINFYSSKTIKDFIKEKCDNKEKDKLMEKLPYLLYLMKTDDFWKQIMLFPMSKKKMASVENYMRIVVNTEYVKYSETFVDNKKIILNLLLFELLIHEIFHFLRRLIFLGKKSKEALTPPNSFNKDSKVNDDDKSNIQQNDSEKNAKEKKSTNEEKKYGEIGKRLIKYIFDVETIISISYAAGQKFKDLTLKDEDEIKSLLKILSYEDSSFATFSTSSINGISHVIHDCREY